MSDQNQLSSSTSSRGLCRALKEMKSKVAAHTGMSLSFVELVSTSPAVGLLPALPPSPRSPSALLHKRMHQVQVKQQHHNNNIPRKSEQCYLTDGGREWRSSKAKLCEQSLSYSCSSRSCELVSEPPATGRVPAIVARALFSIATFMVGLSSMGKRVCISCVLLLRALLSSPPLLIKYYLRFLNDNGCLIRDDNHVQSKIKVTQSPQSKKQEATTCCSCRSMLLKSKLRSSFKSLSVQVPRKAFAPLHLNINSSSPASSTDSAASSPHDSPCAPSACSPTKKTLALKSPSFAKLTKSFNHRSSRSHSPISPNKILGQNVPPCGLKPDSSIITMDFQQAQYKLPSQSTTKAQPMVALIALAFALGGLLISKIAAAIAVTCWLLGFLLVALPSSPPALAKKVPYSESCLVSSPSPHRNAM